MNLIGQWNKDKTQCWQIIASDMPKYWAEKPKYRAECWVTSILGLPKLTHTMPWRDTMEEAQRDIPHENE